MIKERRTSLARQQLTDKGLKAVYSRATREGHSVENDGKLLLHLKNTGKETVTVTIKTAYVRAGLKLSDRVVEVEAGKEAFIGPFPPDVYNQPDGHVHINYSQADGVEVSILKF